MPSVNILNSWPGPMRCQRSSTERRRAYRPSFNCSKWTVHIAVCTLADNTVSIITQSSLNCTDRCGMSPTARVPSPSRRLLHQLNSSSTQSGYIDIPLVGLLPGSAYLAPFTFSSTNSSASFQPRRADRRVLPSYLPLQTGPPLHPVPVPGLGLSLHPGLHHNCRDQTIST
jgi:hypothetical protein